MKTYNFEYFKAKQFCYRKQGLVKIKNLSVLPVMWNKYTIKYHFLTFIPYHDNILNTKHFLLYISVAKTSDHF